MKLYAFFAFGKEEIFNQGILAMVSLFQKDRIHERNDTKIVLYTDQPAYFETYFKEGIKFFDIQHRTMEGFKEWMSKPGNKHKNLHRVKLKSLEDICARYPDSQVILLDTDTYLLESLQGHFERLKGNETFMHKDEGCVSKGGKPGLRSHRRFFRTHKLTVEGKTFELPKNFHMFNAGVVGIDTRHADLIQKMIRGHDDIFEQTQYYNAEQFMIGYTLQTHTQLKATDDVIRHWWYLKEFQATIERFIPTLKNKSFKEIVETKLPTAKMPSYEGFKELKFIVPYKFKKKLFEMGWTRGPYITFD
jgi:hypothetical protein